MATLTDPMGSPSSSRTGCGRWTRTADGPAGGGGRGALPPGLSGTGRSGLRRRLVRRCRGVPGVGAVGSAPLALVQLSVDELGQPADLAVDRVQTVALQLEGVAVQPLTGPAQRGPQALRSEEHTSELQSRQYLVCRLLL